MPPEMGDPADMILMRMGNDNAMQIFDFFLDESNVGNEDIDPRMTVIGKGHPAIDHDPVIAAAIEREIHPDLTGPAKRYEKKFLFQHGSGAAIETVDALQTAQGHIGIDFLNRRRRPGEKRCEPARRDDLQRRAMLFGNTAYQTLD